VEKPLEDEEIRKFLLSADKSGEFGTFRVYTLSYYPSRRLKDKISHQLYNHEYDGLAISEKYRSIESELKKFNQRPINPDSIYLGGLGGWELDATFTLYHSKDLFGILDINNLSKINNSQINLGLIPHTALNPCKHKIRGLSGGEGVYVHAYTTDEDGSLWSMHCENKRLK
jgi:hypothetical protein